MKHTSTATIADTFERLERSNPEKSTEWLFAMTVHVLHDMGHDVDDADIAEALYERQQNRNMGD